MDASEAGLPDEAMIRVREDAVAALEDEGLSWTPEPLSSKKAGNDPASMQSMGLA